MNRISASGVRNSNRSDQLKGNVFPFRCRMPVLIGTCAAASLEPAAVAAATADADAAALTPSRRENAGSVLKLHRIGSESATWSGAGASDADAFAAAIAPLSSRREKNAGSVKLQRVGSPAGPSVSGSAAGSDAGDADADAFAAVIAHPLSRRQKSDSVKWVSAIVGERGAAKSYPEWHDRSQLCNKRNNHTKGAPS